MGEQLSYVWINGKASAQLNPFERATAYGDGLFATMRCQRDKITGEVTVLFLSAHLARLTQGAKRLGFEWVASPAFIKHLKQIANSQHEFAVGQSNSFCLKLLISRGVGGRGYLAPAEPKPTEVVSLHPIPSHYIDWQERGIAISTNGTTDRSALRLGRQPLLAGIKHLNRLEQVLIKSQGFAKSCDDILVLDCEDNVIETSMANLFLLEGRQVITPAINFAGVAGVMREQVICRLTELGYNIRVKPVTLAMTKQAQHLFITNSLFGVVDVISLNQTQYPTAKVTQQLRSSLDLIL